MKLIDVVESLGTFDCTGEKQMDTLYTIYATEPWSCESVALVELQPPQGRLPADAASRGMKYFSGGLYRPGVS